MLNPLANVAINKLIVFLEYTDEFIPRQYLSGGLGTQGGPILQIISVKVLMVGVYLNIFCPVWNLRSQEH